MPKGVSRPDQSFVFIMEKVICFFTMLPICGLGNNATIGEDCFEI
jgi:hypothetical protein